MLDVSVASDGRREDVMGPGPQAPIPNRPKVQYISGAPPQSPILRPFRTRMYDREQVWGGIQRIMFFGDCHRTADGRTKDRSFTNMTQSGQLGYPLEFDAVQLSISPVSGDPEYAKVYEQFIHSDYVFKWYFGAQTLWFERPISLMNIRGPATETFLDKETKKAYKLSIIKGKLTPVEVGDAKIPEMTTPDDLSAKLITRFLDMTTPKREARRVTSTESFHAEILRGNGPQGPVIDAYVCMDGILYTPL
jgi:hypothetical protein